MMKTRKVCGVVGLGVVAVVAAVDGLMMLGGCAVVGQGRGLQEGELAVEPRYPEGKRQVAVLDVQVFRDGPRVWMTNTSAREFGATRMWINGWYSKPLDGFAVGQTLEMSLNDFVDVYGDSFRGGGFFATERAEKLVLAQLETEEGLVGLVVVNEKGE